MKKLHRIKKISNNYLMIIIISILICLLIYNYSSEMLNNYVESSLIEIAKLGAESVAKDIDRHLGALETMAKDNKIQDTGITIEEKLLMIDTQYRSDELLRISIADMEGNSRTTDGRSLYIGDRDYFIKAKSGVKNVSDPMISRVDSNHIVVFSVPVYNNNEIVYVLYATYPAEELSLTTDKIELGEEGYSFILNNKGTVIAHNDRSLVSNKVNYIENGQNDQGLNELINLQRQMIEGKSGAGEYNYDGVHKYMGFAPIRGTDWSLGVSAPHRMVFDNINQVLYFLIIASIGVALVIVVLNIYLNFTKKKLDKEMLLSQNAIDTAKIIILSFDKNGTMIEFNKYAEEKTGYKYEDIIHKKNLYQLIQEEDKEKIKAIIDNYDSITNIEFAIKTKKDELIHVMWHVNLSDELRVKDNIELMGIDITDRVLQTRELQDRNEELNALYEELTASEEELKAQFDQLSQQQEEIRKYAYYDVLTGLPNRINFLDQFNMISEEKRNATLIFMDLDNFKLVNDSYGHSYGDLLLKEIGKKLQEINGYKYIVSRLGGDEYGILLLDEIKDEEISRFCTILLDSLKQSIKIENIQLRARVSIGIAKFPENGESFGEVLKYADIAMYKAKELGRNRFVFYTQEMKNQLVEKVTIQDQMNSALENNEFLLHYQPQFDVKDKTIKGFEALVRWNNQKLGMMSPLKFISIAEENLSIIPLGKWIVEKACEFIKNINEEHSGEYSVSINISMIQLLQDDFVDMVFETLEKYKLNPRFIELELTETVLMESFDIVIQKLETLRNAGVGIALDDFGKGYSSLSYLRTLPITTLKIDKSFIDNIDSGGYGDTLTEAIIYIGRKKGLKVVAEGVETQKQLEYLNKKRCDLIQGFLLSKPLPEKEIIELL